MGATGYLAFTCAHSLLLSLGETAFSHMLSRHPRWEEVASAAAQDDGKRDPDSGLSEADSARKA